MPLLTRLAHRLKDACDEYIERIEDSQSGHRDKYGRKTQLWHEREYERERRRRKREARRKEKEMIEGKGKKIEAVMTGAMPHGGSDGDVTLVEEAGLHGDTEIVSREERVEDPAHGRGEGGRDISPMPSEHSISSIQAEVHNRRAGERATARAEAGNEGPEDSEDEEEEESDEDESSQEEDEAAEAAKASTATREPAGEEPAASASASGLRGGGGGEVAGVDEEGSDEDEYFSLDEEEYNEHEDFDDEYANTNEQPPSENGPATKLEKQKGVEGERQAPRDLNEEQIRSDSSLAALECASETKHEEHKDNDDDHKSGGFHEEHTGLEPPEQAESASRPKYEAHGEKSKQPNDKPQDCEHWVHSNADKSGQAEGVMASQTNGKLPDRTPRPYALPRVQDTLRVVRPTEAPKEPDNKQQQNAREASKAKLPAKGKAAQRQGEAPRLNSKARKAPEPTEDGPSESWARARERSALPKKRVVNTHEEWVSDEFSGAIPQTGRFYRGGPYSDYPYPKRKSYGAHEPTVDSLSDFQPGAEFLGAIPRTGRFYHAGPYKSYGGYPFHGGPSLGGQYTARYDGYGGQNAPRGRYGEPSSTNQSYRAPRFADNHSDLKGRSFGRRRLGRKWRPQPGSSSDESFSSDSRAPSPSPPPQPRRKGPGRRPYKEPFPSPPPRRTRRGGGRTPLRDGSPPPRYNNVDSVKEAPPNYYALLGLEPCATPKEIEVASRRMRVKYHPDKLLPLGHDKTEEEVTKIRVKAGRVAQAPEILKDPIQPRGQNTTWKFAFGSVDMEAYYRPKKRIDVRFGSA
ncbi:MAG: hypothetical protein Q9225_004905 [Loekoesia sp. 1 TL-2023]